MNKRIWSALLLLALLASPALGAPAPEAAAGMGCPPVAENLEIETYRGVSVGGVLLAADPDGDVSGFEITTPPAKGSVELGEEGQFVYIPLPGKRGRDYFGYRALDKAGNVSQEATVIIRLKKQTTQTCYADMEGNGAHYAALRLAEEGIFQGRTVAGRALFEPEVPVSREDFLAMGMALTGSRLLSGVKRTGFRDDAAIPVWSKAFVATALMDGVVSGYGSPGGAEFRPEAPITGYEAAAVLDRLLHITDVTVLPSEEAVPVWARQSTANALACGVGASLSEKAITRGEAATMLLAAETLLAKR